MDNLMDNFVNGYFYLRVIKNKCPECVTAS